MAFPPLHCGGSYCTIYFKCIRRIRMTRPENQNKKYSQKTIHMSFVSIYPALLVSTLVPALASLISGIIVGNAYSPAAMAAVSFATAASTVIGAIGVAFSSGAGILYGQSLGRGQSEEVHRIFTADVVSVVLTGILLTLLGEIFAGPLAALLGAQGESHPETVNYLRGSFLGLTPCILIPSLISFLNLGNEAKSGMLSSIILAAANLVLGVLSVRVFDAGMFGIGAAASLSQYLAAAFLIFRFVRRKELGHLVKGAGIPAITLQILRYGASSSMHEFFCAIRTAALNSMTFTAGGTVAVAAMGVYNSTGGAFAASLAAMSAAAATLVSIAVGEEDRTHLYNLTRYLLKTSAVIFLINGVIYALAAPAVAVLFGAAGLQKDLTVLCIRLYCLEFLGSWCMFTFQGIHQSLGRTGYAILLEFLTNIVYSLGAAWLLARPFGFAGICVSIPVSCYLCDLTLFITAWIKTGHFPKSIADWLWLDESFGVSDDQRIAISVEDPEGVLQVSRSVQDFCESRGIDRRRSMLSALCLEEMAGNTMENIEAVGENTKGLAIDISLVIKDGGIRIRMRDSAPQYDPYRKLEQYNEKADDPAKNLGIRIISKIAKEMKYQATLGMNVLMIEL